MKKAPHIVISFLLLFMALFPLDALAIKAGTNIVKYRKPDGSVISLRIYGDEFFGYAKTVAGSLPIYSPDSFLSLINNGLAFSQIEELRKEGRVHLMGNVTENNFKSETRCQFSSVMEHTSPREKRAVESLVLLVEFSDIPFTMENPQEYFTRMLNSGSFFQNGATGSVSSYLNENFGGRYDFSFNVERVITLSQPREYYGARSGFLNDAAPGKMVEEACMTAYRNGVDFSKYDMDEDGFIDNVAIIFAGHNEAESGEPSAIWPHYGNISNRDIQLGTVKVGGYMCSSEYTGSNTEKIPATIGTFVHEFCHYLGLPDLYDVNAGEEGESNALFGRLSIMDAGNYLNNGHTPPYFTSIEREILSLAEIEDIEPLNSYSLPSVENVSHIYRVKSNVDGEYFLFECRSAGGWDSYIGGSGLIVYHIDKSERVVGGISAASRWSLNIINSFAMHECARILVPVSTAGKENPASLYFPGPSGTTSLNSQGTPKFRDWEMSGLGVSLYDIAYSNGIVTFRTAKDISYIDSLPKAVNLEVVPYQMGAFFKWGVQDIDGNDTEKKLSGRWHLVISDLQNGNICFKSALQNNYIAVGGLEPQKEYKADLHYQHKLSMGEVTSLKFTTTEITSQFPFLKIKGEYKVGDVIHISLQNLPGPPVGAKVVVNGELLVSEYFIPQNEGEYDIEISIPLPDRSVEVITKTVIVK